MTRRAYVRCAYLPASHGWSLMCGICPSWTRIPADPSVAAYETVTPVVETARYHVQEHAAGRAAPPFRFYYPAGTS